MSILRLTEETNASEDDCSVVSKGLIEFNHRHMPRSEASPLTIFLRDDSGAIHGGLLAPTRWHWLLVDKLWVSDQYRGQGHGSALLNRAEAIARSRGCRNAALDTTEFQARRFYEKLGYVVFGQLDDCPPGSRTYWLSKSLESGGPATATNKANSTI